MSEPYWHPDLATPQLWGEYDEAAEWCAENGVSGDFGTQLPPNLSAGCVGLINDDREAFVERVRLTAYAMAMAAST